MSKRAARRTAVDRSGVQAVADARTRHLQTAVTLLSLLKRHYTEHGVLVDDAAMGTVADALSREFYSGLQVEPLPRPERQMRALRKELAIVLKERTELFLRASALQRDLSAMTVARDQARMAQATALARAASRTRTTRRRRIR